MENFADEQFKEYWQKTEVIREYQQILYTFGDMRLPYVFVSEHHSHNDRTVIRRGVLYIQKPSILLPGHYCERRSKSVPPGGRFKIVPL